MSMEGKMSVRMRVTERRPAMKISAEKTATVYGRRSASRTIHMRFPEPPDRALVLTGCPTRAHPSAHGWNAATARGEDACYHNVCVSRVSGLREMPSSQEKGAVRPGLEHEGTVLRRTSLVLLIALFPSLSRAQSPTPDAGTQPSLSTLSRPPEPVEGPDSRI